MADDRSMGTSTGRSRTRPLLAVGVFTMAVLGLSNCLGMGQNGRISAHGRVIDASTGAPLEAVEIRIRRSSFSLLGKDFAKVDRDVEQFDGEFEVGCWRCRVIELDFVKPGYHRKRVALSLDPEDVGAGSRSEEWIEVALVAEGEIVRLERYAGILQQAPYGSRVLPVASGPTVHTISPELLAEHAGAVGGGDETAYVALAVEVDAEGRLVIVETANGWPKPSRPRIDFAPADGGAIDYQPEAFYVDEIDVEMREAPATGYRPTLALDPEADHTRYFYVKIGERYGRGQVGPVRIERTGQGQRAVVGIELMLSPEPGSRNLETR